MIASKNEFKYSKLVKKYNIEKILIQQLKMKTVQRLKKTYIVLEIINNLFNFDLKKEAIS